MSSRASSAPWHHLGALGFFLFWVVAATGIYLFAFFDTSVAGAHASVERLSREQWWFGGVMRSLHRYGSDAFIAVALLHLLRELLAGHFRGFRWFSWTTGVVLLWFIYASGIVGYWLVWDRVGQFSATATAEWFDVFALGSGPVVRNFLTPADVSDRLFSLFVFLHIGVPLALLMVMWIHIQRIAHTDTNPPRALGWAVLGTLFAVSLARPAQSDAAAAFGALPPALPFDWFYLFAHPLMYASSPAALWWIAAAATLVLLSLPLFARRRRAAAVVNLPRCTGCGHCARDCPYLAISLVPRSDGRAFLKQAVVRAEQCAACGICAGSCPTAVPPPRGPVRPGIDLPDRTLQAIREKIDRAHLERRALVFSCRHDRSQPPAAGACVIELECAGQLPPSFLDYALRRGAAAVSVTGCRPGACEFRLGAGWTEQRIDGTREPHLNANVARGKIRLLWWQPRNTARAIQFAVFMLAAALLAWLSFDPPYRPLGEGEALVRVIVVHAGERLVPCRTLSAAELAARAPNMRAPEACARGRHPVPLRIELGGEVLIDEQLAPSGIARDGAAQLYRRFAVPAGQKALRVRVAEAPRPGARAWEREEEVRLAPGRVLTIDFRPQQGGILFL
ncbi:MAG: hydrogenase iron-sulfur subunit [Betaproteobacteria bacterium]|nr:MAG: hydrogenase iron-sulfur subunit [Betaproteobacteria bacterium]